MLRTISIVGNMCHGYQDRTALYKTSEPAFLVDQYSHTVLKHGPREEIQAIHNQFLQTYAKYELDGHELRVVAFEADKVDHALLQGFLNDGRSLVAWCEQHATIC